MVASDDDWRRVQNTKENRLGSLRRSVPGRRLERGIIRFEANSHPQDYKDCLSKSLLWRVGPVHEGNELSLHHQTIRRLWRLRLPVPHPRVLPTRRPLHLSVKLQQVKGVSPQKGCRDLGRPHRWAGAPPPIRLPAQGSEAWKRAGETGGRQRSTRSVSRVFKLADFGFSKKLKNVKGTVIGTEAFRDPQLFYT